MAKVRHSLTGSVDRRSLRPSLRGALTAPFAYPPPLAMNPLPSLRTLLVLGRVSNLPTIWTNAMAGWFLCGGGWSTTFLWVVLGMSLLYLAGMALNDAFDHEWDREHAPERPLPSGAISLPWVWSVGLLQMVGGLAFLLLGGGVHPVLAGALAAAILVYNWLHKRTKASALIMGLCRALVYLGAGSAVAVHTGSIEVSPVVWIVAAFMVLHIVGITLAARSERLHPPQALSYLQRGLLMLPVLFPFVASRTSPEGLATTSLIVVGFIGIWSWLVMVRKAFLQSVPDGVTRAIAGIAFYDAAIVAFADLTAAVLCLGCFALTRFAQRHIPAT